MEPQVETGDEGYLLDLTAWSEAVAEHFAKTEDLTLTEDHWAVIRFVRQWCDEHGVAPSSRDVTAFMKAQGAQTNGATE